MPRRDGMGPYGQGSFTGKGLGCCVVRLDGETGLGLGLGYTRGRERRITSENRYNRTRRNNIEAQIEFHKSRIEILKNQLETE